MMLRVYSNYWRRNGRSGYSEPGLTLIEVLLGLVLLGSLLAAVSLAKAGFKVQLATAQRQLRAVAAADQWLATQWQASQAIPDQGEGLLPGEDGFAWRIGLSDNPDIEELQARAVLLEVIDKRLNAQDSVILALELVLPDSAEGVDSE